MWLPLLIGINFTLTWISKYMPSKVWDEITYPFQNCNGSTVNTLRPKQNGRHFSDDIFKCIFLNENVKIPIKISLKFIPRGPINYITTLIQIMAWRRPSDKPLSEPMMVSLLTHICITRPQWVKGWEWIINFISQFTMDAIANPSLNESSRDVVIIHYTAEWIKSES